MTTKREEMFVWRAEVNLKLSRLVIVGNYSHSDPSEPSQAPSRVCLHTRCFSPEATLVPAMTHFSHHASLWVMSCRFSLQPWNCFQTSLLSSNQLLIAQTLWALVLLWTGVYMLSVTGCHLIMRISCCPIRTGLEMIPPRLCFVWRIRTG